MSRHHTCVAIDRGAAPLGHTRPGFVAIPEVNEMLQAAHGFAWSSGNSIGEILDLGQRCGVAPTIFAKQVASRRLD